MGNYAFIDSQNLNLGVREQGWRLDLKRFRVYLLDKYQVTKAFIFIGFRSDNSDLYKFLQDTGYICIFKPTIETKHGVVKGNCDAELVLHAMIEYRNYECAVIVSGDGDFQCLIRYLEEQGKLRAVLIPNQRKYSALLKTDAIKPYLRFVSDLKEKVGLHEQKNPRKD
jgi:uncharacterized LabA/DUF88 family protein